MEREFGDQPGVTEADVEEAVDDPEAGGPLAPESGDEATLEGEDATGPAGDPDEDDGA